MTLGMTVGFRDRELAPRRVKNMARDVQGIGQGWGCRYCFRAEDCGDRPKSREDLGTNHCHLTSASFPYSAQVTNLTDAVML